MTWTRQQRHTRGSIMGERGPWTFVLHENGATTWHDGASGMWPPRGVRTEVVPAAELREAEEQRDMNRAVLNESEELLGEARAKLSECEKEVAILRNVHYRTDGCCTAAAELEAAQDRCRELEGELAELKKAALHVIDTLPPDIRADFHRGA